MRINQRGINIIRKWERVELKAIRVHLGGGKYEGWWTIGYGHTDGVKEGDVITIEVAEIFLKNDIKDVEQDVESLVSVPINENQFSALVCLLYNIGSGRFQRSLVRELLNQHDYLGAAMHFTDHVYAKGGDGVILQGLYKRRIDEMELFQLPM